MIDPEPTNGEPIKPINGEPINDVFSYNGIDVGFDNYPMIDDPIADCESWGGDDNESFFN